MPIWKVLLVMVSRRTVLSGIAGVSVPLSSGCLDDGPESESSDPSLLEMSIPEVFAGPEENPIGVQLTLESLVLSQTDIPRLGFELYNDGEEPIAFRHPESLIFSPEQSDPAGLTIITTEEAAAIEDDESELSGASNNTCLSLETSPDRDGDESHTTIEPDDSLAQEIAIIPYDDAIDEYCIEPQSYSVLAPYDFYLHSVDEDEPDFAPEMGVTVEFTRPSE